MKTLWPLASKLIFWCAVVVVAAGSMVPVDYLPPQSLNIWDKAQHAAGFSMLTLLGWVAYPNSPWRLCLGLLAFGAGIEVAQTATGWRYGDWIDLLADAVGIALVAAPAMALRPLTRP